MNNTENNNPLSDETFKEAIKQLIELKIEYEEVENQRTDHKLNQRSYTNLWLFIIALYCLWELLKDIIPLILASKFISYTTQLF